MAGTSVGGKKAAAKNLARDPEFYSKIGKKGGQNGRTGGFASYNDCECSEFPFLHRKARCAGAKGGRISRKPKKAEVTT